MRSLALAVVAVFAVSCGGVVETTSGAGGATSTGVGASSTGSGKTSSATSSGNTSSSGSGGAGACVGYFDVAADNGASVHYGSVCDGSWGANESTTALGYSFSGGPAPGVQALDLVGCVSAAPKSEGIFVSLSNAMAPGTFTQGSVTWTDPSGTPWGVSGDSFSVVVTKVDAVGGSIDGHFDAMTTHGGNAAHNLSGTFHVCRVHDELAP